MVTHYQVLGVAMAAGHDEIKRAYHRLARRHHPDTHSQASTAVQESARRIMVDINAAWAVLGDPDRRRQYDAELAPRPPPTEDGAPTDGPLSPAGFPDWFEPDWFDPDEEVPAALLEEDVHHGPRGPGEMIVFVPVALAALAVATFALALVVQWPALFAVSLLLVPLTLVSFLAAPFVAMATRVRSRPEPAGD
ncbi:MAG TPA: J domain-containing protein [Acidimicrobiales bacterium]|nr:J domain-containing protein [Acidimicrobiales bacterium]